MMEIREAEPGENGKDSRMWETPEGGNPEFWAYLRARYEEGRTIEIQDAHNVGRDTRQADTQTGEQGDRAGKAETDRDNETIDKDREATR